MAPRRASSSGFGMTCLDDSTIVRLLAGRLDDALRSRVDDELARCGRCAALVAEVARGSSRILIEPSCPTPEVQCLHEPDDEARYLLGAEIARGGMGTIFAAFDRRLSRSIAIKRLACDDPLLGARF